VRDTVAGVPDSLPAPGGAADSRAEAAEDTAGPGAHTVAVVDDCGRHDQVGHGMDVGFGTGVVAVQQWPCS
jgi:hypothetical protein